MLIALQIYAQVFNPGGGIQKRAEKLCQKSSGIFWFLDNIQIGC